MRAKGIWLVLVISVLSACTLQSGSLNIDESTPELTIAPSQTPTEPVTNTPPVPTSTESVKLVSATATPCTPQSDWPVYTVVSGDTLGRIAELSEASVDSLAVANCLTDTNLISTGQRLYVPVLPELPMDFVMQPSSNKVTVAPIIAVEELWVVVRPGETVTFSWMGFAPGATSVEFYLQRLDIPVGVQTIGVDTNLTDGASMQWPVISIWATITATAKQGTTVLNQTGEALQFKTVSAGDAPGQVVISPTLRSQDGWLYLRAGQTVTIRWPYAENLGDVAVYFYAAPTGTGITPHNIGEDHNVYDGVSVQWVMPAGFTGYIGARAGTKGGSVLVATTDQDVGVVAE